MSDLTKVLPKESETVKAIYAHWKQRGNAEPERGYLGGSAIGKDCERALWYEFRDCSKPDFSGRLYRLFNRGHREEPVFVEELKAIGCEVHEVDQNGNQFEVVAFGGHFKGHADGVALGIPEAPKTWHLLEMKTSNTKEFKKVKEIGVEKHKPQHFAQMQIYMHLMKLQRALYIVVCKETDELYSERVRYDSKVADAILNRAERVIFSTTPPERIADRADAFACKFCDARELCHNVGETAVPTPKLSCRQCCHATAERDGTWACAKGETFGEVCKHHLTLPALLDWAEPTDSLKNDDGSEVIEFTAKKDGSVTVQPNLEAKWSTEIDGIEVVWSGKAEEITSEWSGYVNFPMSNPIFTQDSKAYNAADFGSACAIIYANGSAEIRIDKNQDK